MMYSIVKNNILLEIGAYMVARKLSYKHNLKKTAIYLIVRRMVRKNYNDVAFLFKKKKNLKIYGTIMDYADILDTALESSPSAQLLEFFKGVDLKKLEQRINALNMITSKATPLYTLKELEDITGEMKSHLIDNKEHLVKTGFPKKSFNRSYWHDLNLNKLYYIKTPNLNSWLEKQLNSLFEGIGDIDKEHLLLTPINSTKLELDSDGNSYKYTYQWYKTNQNNLPNKQPSDLDFNLQSNMVEGCSYEDAPLVIGLNKEDAERLVNIRGKVFSLKIRILETLQDALKNRNSSGLLEKCLDIAIKELGFLAEDLYFLLSQDSFFRNKTLGRLEATYDQDNLFTFLFFNNAGIFDLFRTVAHYDYEIKTQEMDWVSKELQNFPRVISFSDYCKNIIGQTCQNRFDEVLDNFMEAEKNHANHLSVFISNMLEYVFNESTSIADFGEVGQIKVPLQAKENLIAAMKDNLDNYLKIMETRGIKTPPQYFMGKLGDNWKIVFEGEESFFGHLVGFDIIAYLLKNPYAEISVEQLYYLFGKKGKSSGDLPTHRLVENLTQKQKLAHIEELKKNAIYLNGNTKQLVQNTNEIKEIDKRIKEIDQYLMKLSPESNEFKELAQEQERLEKESKMQKDSFNNKYKKNATDTVKNNYDNSIKKLNKYPESKKLRDYLKKNITYENYCYMYEDNIPWVIRQYQ